MDEESRFYKIDDAIQRLATVSADLSKMLAVHEQRLDTQEKAADTLSASLEKRRDEVDAKFKDLKDYFEKIIGEPIVNWENHGFNGCFQITTAEDPQVYHCDQQKWAAMIYLTPNAPYDSGTRLHIHRETGMFHGTDPNIGNAFAGGFYDSTKFDTFAYAGNVFNRLVIMDARNIHSAGTYFGNSRETGRLVQLFFFD